MDNRGGDH